MMKILVACYSPFAVWCMPDAAHLELFHQFPEHTFVCADNDAEALAGIVDADVVFGGSVKPAQLAAARQLRWIHCPAAGLMGMLFPEMIASDVRMTNSRGNSARSIAEHVLAVTLAIWRELPRAYRLQQQGRWAQEHFDSGSSFRRVQGARVLIVGLGSIGSETGRVFTALGADVVGVRRRSPSGTLHAELPRADVVVVAAAPTAETWHLIGERELELMKADAVLVSISRGSLVDETALVRALQAGRLRGAALDVFEQEPLPAESPLWNLPNVLLTPHVSGFHPGYWSGVVSIFADNLRRFAAGQPLVNVVDKQAGY
jgi:phosphoglycerate dehydrogenase-like enzyme